MFSASRATPGQTARPASAAVPRRDAGLRRAALALWLLPMATFAVISLLVLTNRNTAAAGATPP